MAWSYSMYMMALEREELLQRRHAHLEQGGASVSTVSGNMNAPDSQPIGTSQEVGEVRRLLWSLGVNVLWWWLGGAWSV